ncbi:ABC transporter permease [Bacillus sp. Marseille-Q1617]|uniref:ABC transporter permease n=1 Tax=Bacillus sp. Marseille-Q1617 TaxID=2736887 RepID=UPI001589EF5D|nr:ABC transporter permease [Bacillus sp. Marseille-Q1617]
MFSLSLKEIRFYKMRYLLIGFILFFVASLVFIISGLANGLSTDNASSIQNMKAHAYYIDEDAEARIDQSRLEIPHETASPGLEPLVLQMRSLLKEDSDKNVDVTLMAVKSDGFLMPEVTEGKWPLKSTNSHVIADISLQKEGIEIGDTLYDEQFDKRFTVSGFTDQQTFSHTPAVFMDIVWWNEMVPENQKNTVNALVLEKENHELQKDVRSNVAGGTWTSKDEVIAGIPGYQAEQSSLYMMLVFLVVIAVFVLAAFFFIMTIQKMNEFGVLKAIGAKNGFLIGTTLLQVLILSLISIGASIGFTALMPNWLPGDIPFVFDLRLILTFSGVLLIVSLAGALLSAANIVKADPLTAMGRAE